MPRYEVTAPDGHKYEINTPEGATEQDAIEHLKSQLGQATVTQSKANPYMEKVGKEGTLRRAALGVGGGIYGMYLGGKQILGLDEPGEIEQHKQKMDALRSTTAGTVGDIAGQIGVGMLAPGAGTYLGAAAVGGGLGALQPTTDDQSRFNNAALGAAGGVAGNAIGRGISKLIQPIPRLPSQGVADGTAAAGRINYPLTAGDKTGSTGLQQVEDLLSRTPGSAGAMNRIYDTKQLAVNRAAAKSIGETADDISEGTFAAAKARLGSQFKQLSENAQVQIGDDFMNSLNTIKAGNDQLGAFRNAEIDKLVGQGIDLAKQGNLDGKAYQTIRSKLSDRASDAFKSSNSELGQALKTVRDALDTSARNGMDDATKEAWDTVRKQYSNLKVLEKGNVVSAGNVNPKLVANALRQFNPSAFKSGSLNGELMDIARVGQNFKIPQQGSQTYERSTMSNMLFGNPLTGLPLVAGSRALQGALMNKPMQQYLTKGMANLPPEIQMMLLKSGAIGGGVAGANAGN